MKTISAAILLLLALILLGCSDNADPIVSPNDQAFGPVSTAGLAKEGILHSATGGCHVFAFYNAEPVYNGMVAFSAIQHSEDVVSGQLEHHDWEYGFSFHGKILDLKVADVQGGKQAKLTWEITKGKYPDWFPLTPKYGCMVVQDNGKGGGDFHTGVFFFPETGFLGLDVQSVIDMTPEQMNAFLVSKGWGPQMWVGQHGNFTVR
jgi:hypothetical protein